MGILSWWKGGNSATATTTTTTTTSTNQSLTVSSPVSQPTQQKTDLKPEEVPGMYGAVEVRRRNSELDVMVFEFGSVKDSADKVTLAGYCPVSEDIEPCRWELLPAGDSDAPQFRVVF